MRRFHPARRHDHNHNHSNNNNNNHHHRRRHFHRKQARTRGRVYNSEHTARSDMIASRRGCDLNQLDVRRLFGAEISASQIGAPKLVSPDLDRAGQRRFLSRIICTEQPATVTKRMEGAGTSFGQRQSNGRRALTWLA